jgi:hypothetical protein
MPDAAHVHVTFDIKDLRAYAGTPVELRGWVAPARRQDSRILRQDWVSPARSARRSSPADRNPRQTSQESSVVVTGTPREDKRAPGGVELTLSSVHEVQHAEGFPITPKEHSSAFLLDHRHLWLRSKKQHVVLLVRHHTIAAIRDYLNSHGFINLDTPIFTPNACEGTSTLFETDYFGDKAYLSQSGQLYNEAPRPRSEGLRLRPDVSRGEIEDAAPPHRILDGGARGGVHGVARVDGTRRGFLLLRHCARLGDVRDGHSRSVGARHIQAGSGQEALPAHPL